MRIVFAINGTRGDVQPAMVLAAALAEAGHDVLAGVPPNLVQVARRFRVPALALGPDSREQIAAASALRAAAGGNPWRQLQAAMAVKDLGWSRMVADMATLVVDADVLVSGFTTEQVALPYAEASGIPLVSLHHAPVRSNDRVGPVPALGRAPRAVLRAQWACVNGTFAILTRGRENALRSRLNLAPASATFASRMRHVPGAEIQAYDQCFAIRDDRWRRDSQCRPRPVVGFFAAPQSRTVGVAATLDTGVRPDPDGQCDQGFTTKGSTTKGLTAWLTAGEPPIYIGFGSMPIRDPHRLGDAISALARRTGRRILLCSGWNDLSASFANKNTDPTADGLSKPGGQIDIRIVDEVDHADVFAQCAAVIHHGGAGTTAAALRAGVPQVICWYGSDQPYWGAEIERLEVGAALPVKKLDAEVLVAAVGRALASRDRAREVSAVLTDPGAAVAAAVRHIEALGNGDGAAHTCSRVKQVKAASKYPASEEESCTQDP